MKILCACMGNKDRSPIVAAFLKQMLENQGRDMDEFIIDSAGVAESARAGRSAPDLAKAAAWVFGLDIGQHQQCHVDDHDLESYELVVVADKNVQAELVGKVKCEIICLELEGAANAWMSNDPRKVDEMVLSIQYAVAKWVIQYMFAD